MKKGITQILFTVLTLLLSICITACSSSTPCESCGRTPTKAYKNTYTEEKEYYCERCSSDCAFCSKDATKHYTSGLGRIIFVCDSCYEYIWELNN